MLNAMNEFEKLESALVRVGRELEYPATPAIAPRVRLELARGGVMPGRAAAAPRHWMRILVPIAAAILVALVLLFALPGARDAVAQFLGLRGLRIFYVTPTPTALSTATARSESTTLGTPPANVTASAVPRATRTPTVKPFTLCCEVSLQEAQRRARLRLVAPLKETPSKVYYQDVYNNGEQVVMVFGEPENPRFTLYQAQRWIYGKLVDGGGVGKQIGAQTVISETVVNGTRALWFSGAPHLVMMLDARGEPIYDTVRPVEGNTLVWETGAADSGVIYRLETKLGLDEAVRIAESLEVLKP